MTTVSVVIPTYNCAPRLMQALRSVAAQSYPQQRIEAIVIDDGSTDDTAERVAAFAAESSLRVRYQRQINSGPSAARNHGMRLATSNAIAFLDADDAWLPAKLELQLPLLAGKVGLVYCGNSFVDADGNAINDYVRRIALERGDILLPLFCDFFLLTSAVVLTKAVVDDVGGFNENLGVGEDYEYFLRVARRFHADYVPQPLLVRCVRADSLSRLDYAKDARSDLQTLNALLHDDEDFAQRHRGSIARRMASYRYDFAYRLLQDGRRHEAIHELMASLRARPSMAAARTTLRALLSRGIAETVKPTCTP